MSSTSSLRAESKPNLSTIHCPGLHRAWQVSLAITILSGFFHLLNLVGEGRLNVGFALFTPFRIAFGVSWVLLIICFTCERRLPKLDRTDVMLVLVFVFFLARGAINPETFSMVLNWVLTGAGVFFLVRHGIRNISDVRLVLFTIVAGALVVGIYGLIEYISASNPLFDSIQISILGNDQRVHASSQLYRIRSLIGHPGFVGAMMLGVMPITMLVLWRRRFLMVTAMVLLVATLFITFSRGSWLLGILVMLPILALRARHWLRRNLMWVIPVALVPLILMAVDYWGRDEVWAELGSPIRDNGLHWIKSKDGPVVVTSGQAYGIQPYDKYIYFDVDDEFYQSGQGPVTVTVSFFDKGTGAVHIDYDGIDESIGQEGGIYTATAAVNKTNTQEWTSVAFYIEQPRFGGRQNGDADFRIVDDDSIFTVDRVAMQKGTLKLPSLVAQQWLSRSTSLSMRMDLYPFAWEVLSENPMGVGIYNTPGTDHHAADSLPLTWMMEFGWLGLLLLGGLLILVAYEGIKAWKDPQSPAVILLFSIVIVLLHGGHLMILYDKPILVMTAALAGVYAEIRPWRRNGPVIPVSNDSCMV